MTSTSAAGVTDAILFLSPTFHTLKNNKNIVALWDPLPGPTTTVSAVAGDHDDITILTLLCAMLQG